MSALDVVDYIPVTPSDTANLTKAAAGFLVGSISGGAQIAVVTQGGQTRTIPGIIAGIIYPLAGLKAVKATGTTCSSIFAVYDARTQG